MPAHKRLWSHHEEKLSPVDHPREHDEGDARGIVQAPRLDLPLDRERQLLAQGKCTTRRRSCDSKSKTNNTRPASVDDGEEIHRHHRGQVIGQERPPRL
jgi:hypothetical protein